MDNRMWDLLRLAVLVAGARALHGASQPRQAAPIHISFCNVTSPEESSTLALSEPRPPPRRRGRRAQDEAAEFMELPPRLRKQLLRYGAHWTEALFEPES